MKIYPICNPIDNGDGLLLPPPPAAAALQAWQRTLRAGAFPWRLRVGLTVAQPQSVVKTGRGGWHQSETPLHRTTRSQVCSRFSIEAPRRTCLDSCLAEHLPMHVAASMPSTEQAPTASTAIITSPAIHSMPTVTMASHSSPRLRSSRRSARSSCLLYSCSATCARVKCCKRVAKPLTADRPGCARPGGRCAAAASCTPSWPPAGL